jgi:hypothetical protein
MPSLTQQRCHNHLTREAAGRCPECGRTYCRECLTEHEDRVVCAICLLKQAAPERLKRRNTSVTVAISLSFLGMLTAWVFFFSMGRILLLLPASFHDGTVWQELQENLGEQ